MVFRKKKGHNLLNFKRRAPAAAAAAAGGGGVQQEQHQQQLPNETSIFRRESERDFYQNPTILSRLILHQKYPAAIRRLKKVPTEAAIWVSSTRGGTNNYHSRRNADETAGRAAATAATAAADADVASTTVPIHSNRPTAISPSMDQFNRAISASTMISALTDSFDSEAAAPKDIIWNGPATECTPDEKVSRDHSSSLSSSSPDQSSQLHCNNNNKDDNNNNKPYAFRQLPLHMACSNLRLLLTNEKTAKQQLEQLISQLVVTFPQACARRDHEYRLPLHEALWNNASPDVIVLLLIAYPEAVDEPDIYGRTAAELNEYRRGASPVDKQAVSRMLQRNASFWKFAKQEADLRLKHNKNNVLDNVNASVNSTSVLNDSLATEGDYTLATKESAFQGRAAAGNEPEPPTRTETSWSQLEKRVLNLERALAESYEQNYGMAQEISRLEDIQKKYYKVISKQFLAKQVIQLEEDNAELRMQLGLMETILKRNNLTMEDASVFSGPTSIEVDDDDDDDDAGPQAAAQMQNQQQQRQQDEVVQLRDDNQILRAQVASLTSRMEEFQRMLEDYERDANKRKEEETSETQRSTTEEDDMEEEESLAMSLSTTTVHSHLSNMNVDEKALVPMPPTVSPLQRGITHNLDGLLELAETTYGHKFSPELVEAWRNITVDGDNFSLFSGVGGMSVLDKLSEVDIEDEIDDLSLPSPSEVKSNKGQKQSGEEAHEQKGNLSQPSSTDRKSGGDTRQPIQKTYEQTEDMSMYSVLWA